MPVTINGTTGIAGVDGSNTTPAIKGGTSTGTGVFYGTNTVSLATGGTTAVTVDSSQRVGIGTATPYSQFDAYTSINSPTVGEATGVGSIRITNGASALSSSGGLEFKIAGDTNGYGSKIQAINSGGSQLVFAGRQASATWTEYARIDISGNFLLNTTTTLGSAQSTFVATSRPQMSFRSTGATAGKYWRIWADDNNSFSIYNNNNAGTWMSDGGTSWNSSSDEQLKDIIAPISDALDKVSTLRSVTFRWKNGYNDAVNVGLIAQDVQAVLPEAVSEAPDGHLGLSYTSVIPLLVASIKELSAKLDAAEARIAALEAK